jgi:hypothetical protein
MQVDELHIYLLSSIPVKNTFRLRLLKQKVSVWVSGDELVDGACLLVSTQFESQKYEVEDPKVDKLPPVH